MIKGNKRKWKWKRVLLLDYPYLSFYHFTIASPHFKHIKSLKNIIWEDFFIPF